MPKAQAEDKAKGAEDVILTYMTQQNRPFAATDVHLNLRGAVTKSAAQKALVSLADKGHLLKKEYGKTLVFVVTQANQASLTVEELAEIHKETANKKSQLHELKKEASAKQAEAEALQNAPSTVQLAEDVEKARMHTETLARLLAEMKEKGVKRISDSDMAVYNDSLTVWRKRWTTRRKAGKDLLNMLADGLDSAHKEMLESSLSVGKEEDAEAEAAFAKASSSPAP